jgi:hypothetical protein
MLGNLREKGKRENGKCLKYSPKRLRSVFFAEKWC